MSSLLEEALVDAAKLKEAAEQQATAELTEKYSQELNAKMSKILEEQFNPAVFEEADDDFGGLDDLGLDDEEGGDEEGFSFDDDLDFVDDAETDYVDDQVPYGFTNDEDMCPCPEDEEEIEINFNDLVDGGGEEGDGFLSGGGEEGMDMDREDVMKDVAGDEEDYLEEVDLASFGIDEAILEELAVDTDSAKSGWSPRPAAHWEEEIDQFLAGLENGPESEKTGRKDVTKQIGPADKIQDREEEPLDESKGSSLSESEIKVFKRAQKELENLSKANDKLLAENKELKKYNEKFSSKLKQAVKVLRNYHLENIKLEYQKSVVENASLNERQKSKLVEAISRAKSETEAETVFNLQESVVASIPSNNELRTENPLEKVLNRRPKPQISIRKQNDKQLNESNANPEDKSQKNYWQKLAGIKRQ